MPNNENPFNGHKSQPCSYDGSLLHTLPAHCTCPPDSAAKPCHCQKLNNPWSRKSMPPAAHLHEASLVAYIRLDQNQLPRDDQEQMLRTYCVQHGFKLEDVFIDKGKPSYGLRDALQSVEQFDGLIAVDLDCFVEHEGDRLRDLRPFIHHFFCRKDKHLITIQEGIDTGYPAGQRAAVDFLEQIKDGFNT